TPDVAHDQTEPVLGLRLQHRRDPGRSLRVAQPHVGRSRHGVFQRVRGRQQPPVAQLQGQTRSAHYPGPLRHHPGPEAGERLTVILDTILSKEHRRSSHTPTITSTTATRLLRAAAADTHPRPTTTPQPRQTK